ncbi:hypothetical protein PFISCL1PPCAC_28290, partial [Pristionchus fissidentatus]
LLQTPPGHSSRMSRFELSLPMETKRSASVPASPIPPIKPKRTFAHDILMAERAAEQREKKERLRMEEEEKRMKEIEDVIN